MGKAIKITAKKAPEPYDLGASKFFGTPTVPLAWDGDFYEDEIFFCQIKLSDIAHLDTENRLPHTGYLYIFLHTEDGKYHLGADVRYHDRGTVGVPKNLLAPMSYPSGAFLTVILIAFPIRIPPYSTISKYISSVAYQPGPSSLVSY